MMNFDQTSFANDCLRASNNLLFEARQQHTPEAMLRLSAAARYAALYADVYASEPASSERWKCLVATFDLEGEQTGQNLPDALVSHIKQMALRHAGKDMASGHIVTKLTESRDVNAFERRAHGLTRDALGLYEVDIASRARSLFAEIECPSTTQDAVTLASEARDMEVASGQIATKNNPQCTQMARLGGEKS